MKLVLELTERNQLSVTAESKALFAKLHQQGVLFALDDFGTGYATHSYLQSFPVDYIKLDKGFVQMVGVDEISGHIVENVIELAHLLGIDIIAEGIETKSQELFMTEKKEAAICRDTAMHLHYPLNSLLLSGYTTAETAKSGITHTEMDQICVPFHLIS